MNDLGNVIELKVGNGDIINMLIQNFVTSQEEKIREREEKKEDLKKAIKKARKTLSSDIKDKIREKYTNSLIDAYYTMLNIGCAEEIKNPKLNIAFDDDFDFYVCVCSCEESDPYLSGDGIYGWVPGSGDSRDFYMVDGYMIDISNLEFDDCIDQIEKLEKKVDRIKEEIYLLEETISAESIEKREKLAHAEVTKNILLGGDDVQKKIQSMVSGLFSPSLLPGTPDNE